MEPRAPEGRVASTPEVGRLVLEPFLHYGRDRIFNPLTDRTLAVGEIGYEEIAALRGGTVVARQIPAHLRAELAAAGWLVEEAPELASRFRLKYVTLEASTTCNQSCYFCPVSVERRADHAMSMEFYEQVVAQLAAYRETIEGVSMIQYNEPTADRHFLDQVRVLKRYGLEPAVLTNATGLTPARVEAILELGGLCYLSVNLSTLDRERYRSERGGDHLGIVLRHLDFIKDKALAPKMDLAVLGTGDERHRQDFEEIRARFAGSRFEVQYYEVMNRAGAVPIGLQPFHRHRRLRGCEQTGSRPVQWVHITPQGRCVLCCQDYHEQYVVGDLHEESLAEILSGPRMTLMRKWVYGLEEAPADFLCRSCIYAIAE